MEDDFDPATQPEWLDFHTVVAAADHEAIKQIFIRPDEQRPRNRTDDQLWAIHEWCQARLDKF